MSTIYKHLLDFYKENDFCCSSSNFCYSYICLQHDDDEQYETVSQPILLSCLFDVVLQNCMIDGCYLNACFIVI